MMDISKSDNVIKGTVVNRTYHFKNGDFLEITFTLYSPIKLNIESNSVILN